MKLPNNSGVKLFGLMLAIAGLLAWVTTQTPSRVLAEFPGKSSPAMTSGLSATTNPVSAAPAGTQTFCNASAITFSNPIPPAAPPVPATPYPSTINVIGMTGTVSSVTVTLNNLTHTFPDDIDLLLVGPTGANAIIMSDAGGNPDAINLTLTLDDAAATSLPDSGPLVSGTFKPTNIVAGDTFPAPAPAPSGGSALSAFNVTNPNGNWSLYAVDDSAGDIGSIAGGWCLTITTEDTEPCTLTCPADITQDNDPTQCAAIVSYPAPTTTGVCGTVTCSPPSGSFFFVGTTTVTCTSATGDQCSFTVTVNPATCPTTFFCNPQTISMSATSVTTPYPSNIGVSGVSGVITSVTVTLNNLTHTFPDDVDVLLVGPTGADAIIMADAGGSPDANNVTLTFDDAAATSLPDAGPLVSGTFKPTNFPPANETFPPPAPTPSGGSALSAFNGTSPNGVWQLFVRDDSAGGDIGSFAGGWCLNITTITPCTITCPSNVSVANDLNQCGAVANYAAPSTTGDCGMVTCTPASGSFFPIGTTTVTCTTTSGPSCSFTVTVNDTQPPTVTCPANQSLTATTGTCSATTTYTATATDNCPGVSAATCSPPSGSSFPVGTTTVTCSATDASGNSGSCSFTVTVSDNENPTVTCPADQTVPAALGQCSATVTFTASATDNCPGVSAATCTPPSGSLFPKGTTTVTCTATDASGNSGSCSFTVTVNDTQNPTVTCPANKTIPTAPGQCSATTTYAATAADNCPGVGAATCTPPSGTSFPKGTTTVTCSATDASGNSGSCSFTVTVNDTQPPTVTCPANQVVPTAPGQCSATATYSATATDNCPGVSAATCTPPSGTSFPVGTTTVTCSATDASGNSGSCSFTVTVVDSQAPNLSCSVSTTTLWPPNHNLINVGLSVTASDNCGSATVSVAVFSDEDDQEPPDGIAHSPDAKNIAPGTLRLRSERTGSGDGRVYLIVVTATDSSGNVTRCCRTVTVAHDQSGASQASVAAQAAAAMAYCSTGTLPPGYHIVGDGPIAGPKQ